MTKVQLLLCILLVGTIVTLSIGKDIAEIKASVDHGNLLITLKKMELNIVTTNTTILYTPSKEELEVANRLWKRVRSLGVETFIAAGGVVWSVTGRLQLMRRLIATFAGASTSAYFSTQWYLKRWPEEFLALDGGHLQETLVAVLQKDAVRKPQMRALLEKYYYIEPLYDDSGQATPGLVLRKREVAGISFEKQSKELDRCDKDRDFLENVNEISPNPKEVVEPTITKKSEDVTTNNMQRIGSNQAVIHNDAFEDPVEGLLSIEAEKSSNLAVNRKHTGRMGVQARREYNRARYLQWQEKRNASGWENAQAEL